MNLINEIKQTSFENYLCLASFDTPDMYIAHELPDIILNTLILNNTDHKIKKVIHICKHYIKTKSTFSTLEHIKTGGGQTRIGCSKLMLNFWNISPIHRTHQDHKYPNHILSSSKCFLNFKNLKITSFVSQHVTAQLDK